MYTGGVGVATGDDAGELASGRAGLLAAGTLAPGPAAGTELAGGLAGMTGAVAEPAGMFDLYGTGTIVAVTTDGVDAPAEPAGTSEPAGAEPAGTFEPAGTEPAGGAAAYVGAETGEVPPLLALPAGTWLLWGTVLVSRAL